MRRTLPFLLALLLAGGCATFKELEPDPPLSPAERGYIELKNDKDNFELDKGDKYFIRFPAPPSPEFALVLVTPAKRSIHSFLTSTFEENTKPGEPITDENGASDSIAVYALGAGTPGYFWIIDSVGSDLVLSLRYRYVPRWRYTFENRYADLQKTLRENTVDRSTYTALDPSYDTDRLDLPGELRNVEQRLGRVTPMQQELVDLERLFPANIAASGDTAYRQFVELKNRTDDELKFQEDYRAVLSLLNQEKLTRGNPGAFLEASPGFTELLAQRDRFPQGVRGKAVAVVANRLPELASFLDETIRSKNDLEPIRPSPSPDAMDALYRAADRPMPAAMDVAVRFINRFNAEVEALSTARAKERALLTTASGAQAGEAYMGLSAQARELRAAIPESRAARSERYAGTMAAIRLGREIQLAESRADDLVSMFGSAAAAAGSMETAAWPSAESSIRRLHETPMLSGSADIAAERTSLVRRLEDRLFTAVRSRSEQRINDFIAAHQMQIDSIAVLYADSAFLPVYNLTFSAQGPEEVVRKRRQIESYLEQIKYHQLPESSIKAIYADFLRDQRDRGVEKARAIVEHGKFYKGDDKQVKGLITECDVTAAKWVIRPKEYRKVFALPVTSNRSGRNEYMFRIRLQIPTEAEFPVYDVNLKLPQEVAEKAGQTQWFESITIDKKPIRNEGRFRVTSPTAENNYETLITPVQMDKNGRHVLEVRFSYPGFRVFEVSAMAQVPIIRKN